MKHKSGLEMHWRYEDGFLPLTSDEEKVTNMLVDNVVDAMLHPQPLWIRPRINTESMIAIITATRKDGIPDVDIKVIRKENMN